MSGVEAGASRHSIVEYGLAGRAAVVTGAATGIGAATAGLLADLGVSVVIADVNEAAGTLTANAIGESGGQARFIACDVSDEDAVRRTIDAAVATYGGIDIVVNCAAAMPLVSSDRDVVQAEVTHWDRMFAVNLRGQMLTCKHAIPGMLRRGGGSIVNISSAAAMHGDLGLTAYGASKAAINHLTTSVATQYGRQGIRCNAIAPGLVRVTRAAPIDPTTPSNDLVAHHLTPYVGQPIDIAHGVAFLCSDRARFITGQVLRIDGGLTVHQPAYAHTLAALDAAHTDDDKTKDQ